MGQIKNIIKIYIFFIILIICFLQVTHIGSSGKFSNEFLTTEYWLYTVRYWNEYGILNMRFSQFIKPMDQEQIFACINFTKTDCPQLTIENQQTPYVSFPVIAHLPLYFLSKIFPYTDLKILSDAIILIYYLITAIILTLLIYNILKITKIHFIYNYLISILIFSHFYVNEFLFSLYSSLFTTETLETVFIVLVLFFRFKLIKTFSTKNLVYYNLSFLLLSFHTFFAYIYIFFEFIFFLFLKKEDIRKNFHNYIFIVLSSILINFTLIYFHTFDFETVLKIFFRANNIYNLPSQYHAGEIFFHKIVLTPLLKYLIIFAFICSLINLLKKTNVIPTIFFLSFFFSCFIFFVLFPDYHYLHDHFNIKLYLLSSLSILPITVFINSFIIKLKKNWLLAPVTSIAIIILTVYLFRELSLIISI